MGPSNTEKKTDPPGTLAREEIEYIENALVVSRWYLGPEPAGLKEKLATMKGKKESDG